MMIGGAQSIIERVSPIGRKSEVSFIEGGRYERLDIMNGLSTVRSEHRVVVLAWLNDEHTLRKEGARPKRGRKHNPTMTSRKVPAMGG